MSNLSSLKTAKTIKKSRRIGRGPGSTKGKTSARGHKGYKARTGSTSRLKFEGGQTSITARIPKLKGFRNVNTADTLVLNLDDVEKIQEKGVLNRTILKKKNLLKRGQKIKILGDGEMTTKVKIVADSFSASAKEKIEKVGGSAEIKKKKSK